MSFMKNMKIEYRLLSAFGLVLSLMVMIGGVSRILLFKKIYLPEAA